MQGSNTGSQSSGCLDSSTLACLQWAEVADSRLTAPTRLWPIEAAQPPTAVACGPPVRRAALQQDWTPAAPRALAGRPLSQHTQHDLQQSMLAAGASTLHAQSSRLMTSRTGPWLQQPQLDLHHHPNLSNTPTIPLLQHPAAHRPLLPFPGAAADSPQVQTPLSCTTERATSSTHLLSIEPHRAAELKRTLLTQPECLLPDAIAIAAFNSVAAKAPRASDLLHAKVAIALIESMVLEGLPGPDIEVPAGLYEACVTQVCVQLAKVSPRVCSHMYSLCSQVIALLSNLVSMTCFYVCEVSTVVQALGSGHMDDVCAGDCQEQHEFFVVKLKIFQAGKQGITVVELTADLHARHFVPTFHHLLASSEEALQVCTFSAIPRVLP